MWLIYSGKFVIVGQFQENAISCNYAFSCFCDIEGILCQYLPKVVMYLL